MTGMAPERPARRSRLRSFLHEHSLSLVLAGVVLALLLLYSGADPSTHLGAFYGNAIADWLGILVFVIATKYFFEVGSGESRKPAREAHVRIGRLLQEHSLTIVLAVTGLAWLLVYLRSDVTGKAGQVIGNVVSAWAQVLGLVILTKYAKERGSKEGH